MKSYSTVTAIVVMLATLPGCPGVSSGPAPKPDPEPERRIDSDGDGILDTDEIKNGTDPYNCADPDPSGCPQEDSAVRDATYAIIVQVSVDSTTAVPVAIGTAFAVGPRLLATNAHIIDAILESGIRIDAIVAVQHGTGKVVELLTAISHPGYDGNPLESPDVGLFTTETALPVTLELMADDQSARLTVGQEVYLAGFPGDVNQLFPITPGETVPQASIATAPLSSFRSFDTGVVVTSENVDVLQYQFAGFPGTSGSPVTEDGLVVAVHNAGTVAVAIVGFDAAGNPILDRIPASEVSFGVHVKHLRALIQLFDNNKIQGHELPPPFLCEPECDFCHLGTNLEGACPTDWMEDDACDCGCQFDDPDCGVPECRSAADCAANQMCILGTCTVIGSDCEDDADCPTGESCLLGLCLTFGAECESKADCDAGEVCNTGVCESAEPECETDADCGAGAVCDAGECEAARPACRVDANCGPGAVCTGGHCVPTGPVCIVDADCDALEICDAGQCKPAGPECATATDCGDGEVCNAGTCELAEQGCGSDADCATGEVCILPANPVRFPAVPRGFCSLTGECETDADCPAGEVCMRRPPGERFEYACTPAARVCQTNADCYPGEICNAEVCEPSAPVCQSGAECDDGDSCTADGCVDGVCSHTQINCDELGNCEICPSGGFCYSMPVDCAGGLAFSLDTCGCEPVPPCTSDADCDAGQICSAGVCEVIECWVARNCDDGNACTSDTCVNRKCVHTSITCDDGSMCTSDSCDPNTGCIFTDISGQCNDGLFCNGSETCDPVQGCQAGADPCPGTDCNEYDGCVSSATLRIVNDLHDRQAGDNDWAKMNTIIRVRIGPDVNSVVNYTTHERLWPLDYTSRFEDTYEIAPAYGQTTSYWDFDVSADGPTYTVYIQTGWWESDGQMWNKHMAIVVGCSGNEAYKWAWATQNHTSGLLIIKASELLPHGSWLYSEFCP